MASPVYRESIEHSIERLNRLALVMYEKNMMQEMMLVMRRGMIAKYSQDSQDERDDDPDWPRHWDGTKKTWNLDCQHMLMMKENLPELKGRTIRPPGTEGDFARLLLSEPYVDTEICAFWRPMFPFCYAKSIEEVAAEPIKLISMSLPYLGWGA